MSTQLAQIRAWLAGDLYPDHETFAMGREFARALVDDMSSSLDHSDPHVEPDERTRSEINRRYVRQGHCYDDQAPLDEIRASAPDGRFGEGVLWLHCPTCDRRWYDAHAAEAVERIPVPNEMRGKVRIGDLGSVTALVLEDGALLDVTDALRATDSVVPLGAAYMQMLWLL